MTLARSTSLRTRLFTTVALIVIASVGVTFAVGFVLTRRAVERATRADLAHQADLLAQRERNFLLPFSRLESLRPFLAKQDETVHEVDLSKPSPFLPDEAREQVRRDVPSEGHVTIAGERYLYAARLVAGNGFVLIRPASLRTSDWWPFVQGLLIAGLIGAALAALASFFSARAIARPVRRVAEASRALAEGRSPAAVPVEGSAELAALATAFN